MRPTRYFQSELLAPEGAAVFSWSPSGELLAAAAQRRKKVVLFDKTGAVVASLTVPDPEFLYDETREAPVLALAWHPAGSHLAILPRGQPFAMVWAVSGDLARVDGGVKPAEVTAIAWSPGSLALALGTARGTGVVCTLATRTITPLQLGRSTKAVECMAWSGAAVPGGLLALGCKGGALLLVRAADGCVARALQLPKAAAVTQLQFCDADAAGEGGCPPGTAAQAGGSLLAANLGRRSLGVWQLPQALAAEHGGASGGLAELSFRDGFGQLSQYCWLSRSILLAGFSSGQLAAATVALGGTAGGGGLQYGGGTGTEVFSSRLLDHPVASLDWCPAAGLLAAAGGGQLAVLRCSPGGGGKPPSLRQEAALLELERNQRVAAVQASPCGRLLTLSTATGRLLQLLASPPLLSGAWGARLAYVDAAAASAEARVLDAASLLPGARGGERLEAAVPLPCEAELLALGPTHLAVAQANKVWLVAVDTDPSAGLLPPPLELEFPAPIRWMRLGAACLLLLGEGGRVFVRLGPAAAAAGGEVVELRGDDGEPFAAGCAALTERCIYVGLPSGTLACYRCSDAALLREFRHEGGALTALHPSPDGSMLLFQDRGGGTFLYHAAHGHLMPLPEYGGGGLAVAIWDGADPELLLVVGEAGTAQVYRHIPASVRGPGVKLVGSQPAAKGAAPLSLLRGVATWHLLGGGLHTQLLDTHQGLEEEGAGLDSGASGSSPELLAARCQQAIALCHWPAALSAATALGDPEQLRGLALAALQLLQPGVAAAAYEAAGDEAAAAALRPLAAEQDEGLVMGIALARTGDDPDRAEELLLGSCRPAAAIEAAARAGRWERAMELAEALEPQAVGGLALLRAQALEAEGQAEAALAAYQAARESPDLVTGGAAAARRRLAECAAGAARCTILAGDVERGAELAAAAGDATLLLQCAELLEQGQHPREAGKLYAAAGQHERAARLLLSCREFGLLDAEMVHAGSPELWHKYAQAKEDLGSYQEAARAYERAGDVAAAVRVLLDRLDDAEAAAALADTHGGAEPRLAVARHCERAGRLEEAMRLYCLAGACPAAFLVAQRNACVPAFAELARAGGWAEAAELAATHYELAGQLAEAGDMAALAGQTERAARLLLQAGGDSITTAVKLAAQAKEGAAAALVLEHLQGAEGGGAALLDLHLALGSWDQACQVAVACAERERAAGNYKSARDQLLRTCLELQARGAPASLALLAALHTLHAYSLVRKLVARGDHSAAARLLLLVAERIAEFPRHAAPILTSTVIECHRAALHGPAQRWAATLLEQHPGQVSAAYAKKVETIARQPAWAAEQGEPEPRGDCLFCGAPGPETSLTCAACARVLPFCAASGKRMLLADWSECPGCRFPCRGQDLARAAALDHCCPLCEAPLEVHDVRRIFDPFTHCRRTVFAGLLGGGAEEGGA